MNQQSSTFPLENGLDLRQVVTSGSVLHINEDYDDSNCNIEPEKPENKPVDFIGQPVTNFKEFEKTLLPIDENDYVKKKILEEGGGLPLHDGNTVSIAFSGYWENDSEPFDARNTHKPLVVDLIDSGLLPGLDMAVRSMLVGEMSVFLLTHEVMYGEMGVPPRIKPKANCVFYIKLLKSILTSKEGKINFSEPNMFHRVHHEVKMLYSSGHTLHKSNNFLAAIHLFRKAIFMLHKCRLADENEEQIQEKLLIKLYLNLAVCYNKIKQPLKACTACNELNRLNSLWNNGKALFQNAKALRMIGQFDSAEKRIRRAMKLCPKSEDINNELKLLQRDKESCNQSKLFMNKVGFKGDNSITDNFKREVENLVKNFKENIDLCKLVMPSGLNSSEVAYIKEVCIRENLFFNKIKKQEDSDKDRENTSSKSANGDVFENYALDRHEEKLCDAEINDADEDENDHGLKNVLLNNNI